MIKEKNNKLALVKEAAVDSGPDYSEEFMDWWNREGEAIFDGHPRHLAFSAWQAAGGKVGRRHPTDGSYLLEETPELYNPEHSKAGKIIQMVKELAVLGSEEDLDAILVLVEHLHGKAASKAWGMEGDNA